MKIQTNPDVVRKHARVPRSYREATGMHFYAQNKIRWREANRREPRYEWFIWSVLFATVIAWLVVA